MKSPNLCDVIYELSLSITESNEKSLVVLPEEIRAAMVVALGTCEENGKKCFDESALFEHMPKGTIARGTGFFRVSPSSTLFDF